MQAADLIPAADSIPAPWGIFQVLLTLTFVLHLLFMNMMLGGTIIGMVEVFGAAYISGQYKDVFAFIIMIAVLYFKPTGIMGENVDDTRV